jgi:hypothetical protein
LTISDTTVAEGDSGTTDAVFTVTLSKPSDQEIVVDYATADVSAASGNDYLAADGVLTFAPGQTVQAITVAVLGDTADEPNETFRVNLTGAVGATIADSQGVGRSSTTMSSCPGSRSAT